MNRRQTWWVSYLFRFDFILKHVLGTKIGKVDRLSIWLDWKVEIEKNNNNQIFIKDYWLHSLSEVVIEGSKVDIIGKIKKARSKNKEVVRIVKKMKKTGVKELQGEK